MQTSPAVEYLPDASVTETVDQELRALLTTCFTKPQDVIFQTQRYFREPYPNRWVIRTEQGAIVAHIGVHEKRIQAGGRDYRIGGIAEVCVHPDYRGRKYVKIMLEVIHAWLRERGFAFSVLFGNPKVYGGCGYQSVQLVYDSDREGRKTVPAMMVPLAGIPWPESEVYLPGPTF